MATTSKKAGSAGFRARRSKNQPKPEEPVEDPEATGDETGGDRPTEPRSDPPGNTAGGGGGSSDQERGRVVDEASSTVGTGPLGVPSEETITLGISTTTALWKYYKTLQNRSGVEGRTIKVAQIIRAVVIEALPDSSSEDGLAKARNYADNWNRARDASSSTRTNRQVYLPRSVVTELKRLAMRLEELGHPTSTSAIICGILDEHRPSSVPSVRKLIAG